MNGIRIELSDRKAREAGMTKPITLYSETGPHHTEELDPRLHAYRAGLADARLRSFVAAPRYVEGQPARIVVGRATVRRSPEPGAPLDTYYHYGDPVLVFDEARGRAWCQSLVDDYVGYVERSLASARSAR
jgi:hypothetical protein